MIAYLICSKKGNVLCVIKDTSPANNSAKEMKNHRLLVIRQWLRCRNMNANLYRNYTVKEVPLWSWDDMPQFA